MHGPHVNFTNQVMPHCFKKWSCQGAPKPSFICKELLCPFILSHFLGFGDVCCLLQSVTNIFEYSNIFYTNIYSDIRSIFLICIYSDIRSYQFLDTNIFGYSFVSKSYSVRVWRIFEYLNIRIIFNTNIHSYHIRIVSFYTNIFGYSFVSFSWYEYIQIFIRIEINTNVTLW